MSTESAIIVFSEILAIDQRLRGRLAKALPAGMELSHFSVLNNLATLRHERTPAQLAQIFHVTRGAMTNTIGKLEKQGFVHIRTDWDDARKKWISISPAGRQARDAALFSAAPFLRDALGTIDEEESRRLVSTLRKLREAL